MGILEKSKKFHDQLEKACIFSKSRIKIRVTQKLCLFQEFMKNVEKLKGIYSGFQLYRYYWKC